MESVKQTKISFIAFLRVVENLTEAGQMNGNTLFYFISSIIWAIGSIVGAFLLGKNFSKIQKYLKTIRKPQALPQYLSWEKETASDASSKADLFNRYFQSVFQITNYVANPLPTSSSPILSSITFPHI